MAESKKKSNPTTRNPHSAKRVFIKLNIDNIKTNQDISPVSIRKRSVDLSSPKNLDSSYEPIQFSSFQSPPKGGPRGKPPLSPNITNISNISGISSIGSRTESPAKAQNKSAKYRQLSKGFVLSKQKFIEKVQYENNKLGVCN
jgi:hypothetical protein